MRNHQDLTEVDIVRRFPDLRVLVIGDAMLDTFVDGTATKLCREAPVPVVDRNQETNCPGGAANTAANLAALGAEVAFVGLVGNDAAGQTLRAALRDAGVSDRWLMTDPDVTTLRKTRLLADGQYVVRLDDGDIAARSPTTRKALLDAVADRFPHCDLVIVSDYEHDTMSDEMIGCLDELRAARPCPLVIDSRELLRFAHSGATLVTPNLDEARAATWHDGDMPDRSPEGIGCELRECLDAGHIAITMAGDGVLLVGPDGRMSRLSTYPVSHADDTGAGDSFTAAAALALTSGAGAQVATSIGIDAASIACTKSRVAVVTRRELVRRVSLNRQATPFAPLSVRDIAIRLDAERHAGRRIVFTNGVFDILHAGHVQLLQRARALGDILVVGINSDASVRRLKGNPRPINHEEDRLALVTALDAVDYALIFDDDTPAGMIRALQPDIHVKGGDYTAESLPEIDAVREAGAQVAILPLLDGLSTTRVIDRIVSLNGHALKETTP